MSDFSRLEAMLAHLRARERAPGEGRKLKGSDADSLIAALVAEIDETILPRRLSLHTEKDAVHFAVANRRLQALLAPAPKTDGAEDLSDQPLPDAEDPNVPALREVLAQFFGKGGPITIKTQPLKASFGSDIGVPANLLGRAWGVDGKAQPKTFSPDEVISQFLGDLAEEGVAWLRIKGEEVTDQGGDEGRTASLGEQAAIFLDGYFAKFEEVFPADALTCGTLIAPAEGDAMLFVEFGEESAFLSGPVEQMPAVAGRWQALVAE
jgi:hypothetical protein